MNEVDEDPLALELGCWPAEPEDHLLACRDAVRDPGERGLRGRPGRRAPGSKCRPDADGCDGLPRERLHLAHDMETEVSAHRPTQDSGNCWTDDQDMTRRVLDDEPETGPQSPTR